MSPLAEAVAAVLLLLGAGLAVAAAIGLLRFPDVLTRMHATSKPSMLGVVLVLMAGALVLDSIDAYAKLAIVAVLQLITTPTGSHMVGRAVWQQDAGLREATPQR